MKRKLCFALSLLLTVGMFAGCGGGAKKGDDEGDITLRWYARINKEADSAEVFEKASEMAKEKIGVNLDIIALEDYDTKISALNASGEDFDIVYTSNVTNNIYQNVNDGNLLALDDLLPQYAPKLWASMSQDVWNGIKIDGKIYGVPNQQIFARGPAFAIPTQNIDLLGLDVDAMKDYTLEDYEPYLQMIKDKTGSNAYLPAAWGGGGSLRFGFEELLGSDLPGVIRFNDDSLEVINQYETQEFQDYIRLRAKWVAEGLTSPMEIKETDITKYVSGPDQVIPWLIVVKTFKPGFEAEYKQSYGIDITTTSKAEPLLSSYGLLSTMAALNSDTRYPEKSVEFLELLNTDPDFYNLLVYGLEGKNYTKVGDNRIELSTDNPYTQPSWAIGNVFNSWLLPGQADDVYVETKKINDEARRSPALGFAPNNDEIKLEVSNCKAVLDEYKDVLDLGLLDVESTYAAFIEKLKNAGVDDLISKLNEQVEAWKSSK